MIYYGIQNGCILFKILYYTHRNDYAPSHIYYILAFGCQNDDSFINQIEMLFLSV